MGRRSLPTDEMNLTERQHRMLDYLKETISKKGYPPTVREICSYIGVKSTSTVHKDLAALQDKGFIVKDPAKPRTIEIIGFNGPTAIGGSRSAGSAGPAGADEISVPGRVDIVDIPLVGRVAAGTPILADQNINIEYMYAFITVSKQFAYVVLRVENNEETEKILSENGIRLVTEKDMEEL